MRHILSSEKKTWQRCARLAGQIVKFDPPRLLGPFGTAGIQPRGEEHPYFLDALHDTPHPDIRFIKGWNALAEIYARLQTRSFPSPYWIMAFPILEVSQRPLNEITPEERLFLDRTGILRDFGGVDGRYPVFRSALPGYLPWIPDSEEAPLFERLLEGALGILLCVEKDPEVIAPYNGGMFVVRQNDAGRWEDTRMEPTRVRIVLKQVVIASEKIAAFARLPMLDLDLEMELIPIPVVPKRGQRRPAAFFTLVGADARGTVFHGGALPSAEGFDSLWANVPGEILNMFQKIGGVPSVLRAASPQLVDLLRKLEIHRPFKLVQQTKLERIPQAAANVCEFFAASKSFPPSSTSQGETPGPGGDGEAT